MRSISVIMSTYNEPVNYLEKAINSILSQTIDDYEYIILIDNPSNLKAKNLVYEYAKKDSRIIVIENERNIGLTASLNKGLKVASGIYIARMDADDISDKSRLEKQMDYLERNNLDLVGCSLQRISDDESIVYKLTNKSYPPECIRETLKLDNSIPHPSWFGKKDLFDKLGGYRDFFACEDYDFLLRALKINARIGLCDDILLSYRVNTNGISRSNSYRQHLASKYLSNHYNNIFDIDCREVEDYVERYYSKEKAIKYEQASQLMNEGIIKIKDRNFVGLMSVLKSALISFEILDNIRRIVKMRLIRNKYCKNFRL